MKCQKALLAPSASLHTPSCGSAGGSVGSRPGAGACSAGGSGRSHNGRGTKEEIIAMGSIQDHMPDVMENQNLLYQVPAVDKVAVAHHHVIIAIQANNLGYYSIEEKVEIINYIITNTTAVATYELLDKELHQAWLCKSALLAPSG